MCQGLLFAKERRNGFLRCLQQLGSYGDEIVTRNGEEIPFSSRIVSRGLSGAEGPQIAPHNTAQLYSNQANPLMGIQLILKPETSLLGNQVMLVFVG